MSSQVYKYRGEEFLLTKPEACAMQVSKGQYTAHITIHTATNQYREQLDGWGLDHDSLQAALDSACRRILDKSSRPDTEQLCKGMTDFFESLNEK